MKRKNFFFYLVAMLFVSPITIAVGSFKINFASALEVSLPGLPPSPTLPEYAAYLFNIAMGSIGILSVAVIALGGIYYLASFSRGKVTNEGKEWVKAGVRGLIFSLCIYLLAYTINPALLLFKLPGLNLIIPNLPQGSGGNNEGTAEVAYQEIPIGTLTETLLSKTMYCYDFDPEGNPIPLELETDKNGKVGGPTYRNHDRVDCLLKLEDAAQKKAKIISDLSKEIKKLTETCKCAGKCNDPCNSGGNGCDNDPPACTGACKGQNGKGAACEQPQGTESCCDAGTKNKVEHGPINICTKTTTTVDVDSFELPIGTQSSGECKVAVEGTIKKAIDIVAGPGVNKNLLQTAMDKWNSVTPYPVFGKIISSSNLSWNDESPDIGSFMLGNAGAICGLASNGKPAGGCAQTYRVGTDDWGIDITGFKIIINSTGYYTEVDILNMMVHELGHTLGLGHPFAGEGKEAKLALNCTSSVMSYVDGITSPGPADIEAINRAYSSSASFLNNSFLSALSQFSPISTAFAAEPSSSSNNACCDDKKEYKGLDEFRSQLSSISDLIEKKVQVDKKDVAVININGNQGIQTFKQWKDLKLIEQLMYFKEKIKEIEDDIKNDINKLDSARKDMADCPTIKSSVDFLKIKEGVKREDKKNISSRPWGDNVDSSKYCKGFNYSNSSCYNLCSNMCPDTTKDVVKCYGQCIKGQCDPVDQDCLDKQQECIGECYDSRACIFQASSNKKTASTFKECVSNCRQDCSDFCSKKYLLCSNEYKLCKDLCDNNSKCILGNKDTCLINSQTTNTNDFEECITQDDYSNIKNCINNSYLCKYGSYEYAGYPDCTSGYTGCDPNTQNLKNKDYSSPYIFDNWEKQRCPDPYKACKEGKNAGVNCLELYPETAKCPSSSYCPDCPCGEIDEEIKFTIDSPTDSSTTTISKKISAHDLVMSECNEFAYNTDPLTFYCRITWEQEEFKWGGGFDCSKADEIPVGQAVDDTKKWANNLLKMTDSYLEGITDIISNAKKINDKKPNEYCRCDSKYDTDVKNGDKSGQPICTSNCQYNKGGSILDASGNLVVIPPSCTLVACNGSACQQMIDYLTQITSDYIQMRTAFINLYVDFLKEPRTDPLKELTYSRSQTDICSQQVVQSGKDNIKTVSCSVAYPGSGFVEKRCYGILDGKAQNPRKDSTDNWFCCRKSNK